MSMAEASPRSKDFMNEIGELIKNICLAVLNWELKQSDEYMYGIKKHQEEFILIKSQEVVKDLLIITIILLNIDHY